MKHSVETHPDTVYQNQLAVKTPIQSRKSDSNTWDRLIFSYQGPWLPGPFLHSQEIQNLLSPVVWYSMGPVWYCPPGKNNGVRGWEAVTDFKLRRIRGKPIPELKEWAFLFRADWKVLEEAFRDLRPKTGDFD